MSRVIRFRAWEDGKMTEPFTIGDILPEGGRFRDEQIMQSTGLYDKNGKEIFEGDVVKNKAGMVEIVKYSFHEGCCCPNMIGFKLSEGNMDNSNREVEIVGNIYEKDLAKDND